MQDLQGDEGSKFDRRAAQGDADKKNSLAKRRAGGMSFVSDRH